MGLSDYDIKRRNEKCFGIAKPEEKKKVYVIPKVSEKKRKAQKKDEELEKWFIDRRIEMTGICQCGCGRRSSKYDDEYFKHSAAHIFPKKNFKSIMYHPLNFIELNFWDGCHTNFDNLGFENCKETNEKLWQIVVERFKILYPLMDKSELKFIPKILLKYAV